MKIIVKIEDGRPALFFPDEPAKPGRVSCFAMGEHSEASRAYMRALPAPAGADELRDAWLGLARYAQDAARHV